MIKFIYFLRFFLISKAKKYMFLKKLFAFDQAKFQANNPFARRSQEEKFLHENFKNGLCLGYTALFAKYLSDEWNKKNLPIVHFNLYTNDYSYYPYLQSVMLTQSHVNQKLDISMMIERKNLQELRDAATNFAEKKQNREKLKLLNDKINDSEYIKDVENSYKNNHKTKFVNKNNDADNLLESEFDLLQNIFKNQFYESLYSKKYEFKAKEFSSDLKNELNYFKNQTKKFVIIKPITITLSLLKHSICIAVINEKSSFFSEKMYFFDSNFGLFQYIGHIDFFPKIFFNYIKNNYGKIVSEDDIYELFFLHSFVLKSQN